MLFQNSRNKQGLNFSMYEAWQNYLLRRLKQRIACFARTIGDFFKKEFPTFLSTKIS
ncbi:uncharacterized protein DS421_14g476950 [Arachis hypogaea]|nr:uncharacterized protein DS421_14g476950 [Arachis hypogaea]